MREQLDADETALLRHTADEPAPAWLVVLVAAYKAKQSEVVTRAGAKSAAAAMAEAAPTVVGGAPPRAPAAQADPSALFDFFNMAALGWARVSAPRRRPCCWAMNRPSKARRACPPCRR